jgi:hypothetical protein
VFTEEYSDPPSVGQITPGRILFEELERARASLLALGIGFSVSPVELPQKSARTQKTPYLCCRYNAGDLGNVNIIAYQHPLLGDWEIMEQDAQRYKQRLRSAIREEMIHALQIITVRKISAMLLATWPLSDSGSLL